MRDICPLCDADLQGAPIPQEYIDKGYYGEATHYSRMMGHEVRGIYDGVLFWSCPDCGGAWPRFSEGGLGELSAQYAAEFNAPQGEDGAA